MKIYLVKANSDMTEGRGRMIIKAAFLHEDDAWAFTEGNWVWTVEPLEVHE